MPYMHCLLLTRYSASLFDPELLEWLVREHHANPNARCKFDITPLSIAAQSASLPVIELLFQLGASVKYGQPLHYAVRSNRSNDIIEFLLRKGASPNSIMFEGDAASFHHFQAFGLGTPLHEAVHQGNERLVRLLLQNGAREDIVDTLGRRPGILQ
jgi:ankyrin repeat protein